MNDRRVGVWLIGAHGSVASAVILGALAMAKGLADGTGMITASPPFDRLGLVPVEQMVFGGCDIRPGGLGQGVDDMAGEVGAGIAAIAKDLVGDLLEIEKSITQGSVRNCGEAVRGLWSGASQPGKSIRQEVADVSHNFHNFKAANKLDVVVVVNLASTEPPLALGNVHENLEAFEECLSRGSDDAVRASTVYAYAAIESGCPYINFTPSNGALFPAMVELSRRRGVPVMGNDGKTGETLVKSVLAPMFMYRNLEVLSWEGFNILGNMDGYVLSHPDNKSSKIRTKETILAKILGYSPHSQVGIDYVPSLGGSKVAWDFIHFKGFLGAKMSMQFVWQGHDSLLAAPLVLDLVRWAVFARDRGEAGLMPQLACYFKSPLGVDEHRLHEQFGMLLDYTGKARPRIGDCNHSPRRTKHGPRRHDGTKRTDPG